MNEETREEIYTPSTIINILSSSIRAKEYSKQVFVKGIYVKHTNSKLNKGFFYDSLKDLYSDFSITLKIPDSIRHTLIDENIYTLKGILLRWVQNNGTISTHLQISELIGEGSEIPKINEDTVKEKHLVDLINEQNKGRTNIDVFLSKMLDDSKIIKIALILPKTNVIENDIFSNLQNYDGSYNFINFPINITAQEDLINALQLIDTQKYDLLIIARGGGNFSDFEVFNNVEIAEKLINLKIPFVIALGHAINNTLLDKIADKCFAVPAQIGKYLDDIMKAAEQRNSYIDRCMKIVTQNNELKMELSNNKNKIETLNTTIDNLNNTINQLTSSENKLQKKEGSAPYYAIIFITIIIIIFFIIYKFVFLK